MCPSYWGLPTCFLHILVLPILWLLRSSYLDSCAHPLHSPGSRCSRKTQCCLYSGQTHRMVWKLQTSLSSYHHHHIIIIIIIIIMWSSFYDDDNVSPVFALIVIRHTAALASPTIVAVALEVAEVMIKISFIVIVMTMMVTVMKSVFAMSLYWNIAYLGVKTGTIDTTMSRRVEAVVWKRGQISPRNHFHPQSVKRTKFICPSEQTDFCRL